jgi:hypothetical protein
MNYTVVQAALQALIFCGLAIGGAQDGRWVTVAVCGIGILNTALNYWAWHLRDQRIAAQHRIIASQLNVIEAQAASLRQLRRVND